MTRQILVSLKRHDPIGEIIPYVEKVAQPGMRVVFLIPYPVEPWLWLQDHWVTTEFPREAMLAGRKIMAKYSWDVQRGLAEKKVALARQALQKRGVEIHVVVYTCSLRNLISRYTANGDIQFIMMRAGIGLRVMRLLHRAVPILGLFKRPSFSPVLLLNPDQGCARRNISVNPVSQRSTFR